MSNNKKKFKRTAIISIILVSIIVLSITIGLAVFAASDDYVQLDIGKIKHPIVSATVLDKNGEIITTQNAYVKLSELKPYTINSFLAVEDSRFYQHNGVDYRGVLRALLKNLYERRMAEGGSTITQQLIKNTHLNGQKTFKRKANEFLLSYQLEKQLSKDEILEAYLNTAYFGNNCVGISMASAHYFGKTPSELTLSESALLAGLLKAPNVYAPDKNMEKAYQRRNLALNLMAKKGYITADQAQKAQSDKIKLNCSISNWIYMSSVLQEACEILGISENNLHSGYVIETYYDKKANEVLDKALSKDSTNYGFEPEKLAFVKDNDTNGIVAISGNVSSVFSIRRQAGSLLKPLAVYAPAVEKNTISVLTPVLDEEISFGDYKPKNFGGVYRGWTTVCDSLAYSLNVPSIKILNMIGVKTSKKYLRAAGFELTDADDNLTLALGSVSNGVTPQQIADGYTALANNGIYSKSSTIKRITLDGVEIYNHNKFRENRKVFSAETAYITTHMLKQAVKYGTSKTLSSVNFDVAAKTGTVGKEKNSDLYMCGYTSDQTFFIRIGDQEERLDASLTSGKVCGEIIKDYLQNIGKTPKPFDVPPGITFKKMDLGYLKQKHILKEADENTTESIIVPTKRAPSVFY